MRYIYLGVAAGEAKFTWWRSGQSACSRSESPGFEPRRQVILEKSDAGFLQRGVRRESNPGRAHENGLYGH